MFLLDTNVLSELRRPDKADRRVRGWASAHPFNAFFISAITVMEIEQGILLIARRDPKQAAILREWFESNVLLRFRGRVLAVNTEVAIRGAKLHVPDPRSERDALIAATALVHDLKVVTQNEVDFRPMGVTLLNPWSD